MTVPNSLVVIVPSPSLSNKAKASLNSEIYSSVSYSDVIIEVVVPAPVQSWRRSGDPDKLGRCSSRAGINPSVHDQAGWEGWLRRWKKAARDVTGSSLLCLLVCALRQRANLVIGKKGLASHKRKKKREDHERVPSLCEGNRIRDNVTQPAKKVKKSVLSPIIAARCAAALRTLMKKDGAFLFLEPVDRTQYPEYFKTIKKPIDLNTILKRVERNPSYYSTVVDFATAICLCFENAVRSQFPTLWVLLTWFAICDRSNSMVLIQKSQRMQRGCAKFSIVCWQSGWMGRPHSTHLTMIAATLAGCHGNTVPSS